MLVNREVLKANKVELGRIDVFMKNWHADEADYSL